MNAIEEQEEVAELCTPQEQETFEWSKQATNNELHHLHEALKQMVTLVTTLLAGSAALYMQLPGHALAKGIAAGLLMASLVTALLGWLPHFDTFRPNVLEDIQAVRGRLINRKTTCLRWCCVGLVLAFATLLGGAILAP